MKPHPFVRVYSFSYHGSGIPDDPEGNGGGFVFDCRMLPNPGREERYVEMSGRDADVVAYLVAHDEIAGFWEHVSALVFGAVKAYGARGYDHLSVAFGCTGGRHRSVYFAERLTSFLTDHSVACHLAHRDLPEDER